MIRSTSYSKGLYFLLILFLVSCHTPGDLTYTTVYRGYSKQGVNCRSLAVINEAVIVAGQGGFFCGRFFSGDYVEQPAVERGEDIRDMHLFNDGSMVLMNSGENAIIYYVAYNGQQSVVYDSAGVFLDGMAFWDDLNGIVYGDPVGGEFFLLRTFNGGKKWFNLKPAQIPAILPAEAGFAASGTGIQCLGDSTVYFATGMSDNSRLFCSYDRGITWSVKNTPVKSGDSYGIYSMYFWTEREGMVVGGSWEKTDYHRKICYYTRDGGNTWTNRSKGLGGYSSCIRGNKDGSCLFVTGDQGTYFTLDKGLTWQLLFERNYYSIAVTETHAIFIGRDGTLEVIGYKF